MELAMLDALIERAREKGIARIHGNYIRTAKNAMVEDHYSKLGFSPQSIAVDGNSSIWVLPVAGYELRNTHIQTGEALVSTQNG